MRLKVLRCLLIIGLLQGLVDGEFSRCEDGSCGASSVLYSSCERVVIGAGWSGSYFAWRTSVDSALFSPHKLCVFEAFDHPGGRAYSVRNVPGMQDLRIDLGAYRFDSHSHPLINHVFSNVLHLHTRCYDAGTCNPSGNLSIVADVYGNNAGYGNGPEKLIELVSKAGAKVFYGHRLINIAQSGSSATPLRLTFANGVEISCKSVFLNMAAKAIGLLNSSILFNDEHASKEAQEALRLPVESIGAKQFLIYPRALWRVFPQLQSGDISDNSEFPPITGRLHDFYGKCSTGAELNGGNDCWGAVLTYYDFVDDEAKGFAAFQNSTADPYTYIPYPSGNAAADAMISSVHKRFMKILDSKNVPNFNSSLIGSPSGTVIAVWWARDELSSLRPSWSLLAPYNAAYMSDPGHRLRNLVTKPLKNFDLWIANEAYSGGDGWAHPSLVLTERIIYQHLSKARPAWVRTDNSKNVANCYFSATTNSDCRDYVDDVWWAQEVASDDASVTGNQPLIPNCPNRKPLDIVTVDSNDKCEIVPEKAASAECKQSIDLASLGVLTWVWDNATHINVTFQMRAAGWAGFGFGSMNNGDLVVARYFDASSSVGHFYSSGHFRPAPFVGVDYIDGLSVQRSADGAFTAHFRRPAALPSALVSFDVSDPKYVSTPVIFAAHNAPLDGDDFPLHTVMSSLLVNFKCGWLKRYTFEEDIVPLFRQKDRDAMLFSLDLYKYDDVVSNAKDILMRLVNRTVLDLPTGMPKDEAWPLANVQIFRAWTKDFARASSACTRTPAPSFCRDIKKLFRTKDRQDMIAYGFDLFQYGDVKRMATKILARLKVDMPCDGRWPAEQIKLFSDWIDCGMEQGDPNECLESDAMVFYKALNIEANQAWLPAAKVALQQYLKDADRCGTDPNFAGIEWGLWHYRDYTVDVFNKLMDELYANLSRATDEYDPSKDPMFQQREQVVNRIVQFAPFNLIDGAWISNCCPTGPIDEVHSLLWGILNDEMGDGDPSKNHCKLYQELLDSIGQAFPDVNTYSFASDPRFLPSAFTQPAYALVLALFSKEFFPELLGTTLQIEWSVLGIGKAAKVLRRWGYNAHFYELHIGIDNAAKGHGYRAKRAIEIYLDEVRKTEGEAGVQAAWRRIWNGFLAFDCLGTLFEDLKAQNAAIAAEQPREAVLKLIQSKGPYGHYNHNTKRLGKVKINELFGNPKEFEKTLRYSAWVVAGNPDVSPIMTYLTAFDGPMFKVFEENELGVWRTWIRSLRSFEKPKGRLDSYLAMRQVIRRLRAVAMSVEEHHLNKLWGPAQSESAKEDFAAHGKRVEQTVSVWLDIDDPDSVMAALCDPKNDLMVPFNSSVSPFVTKVLANNGRMGKMFENVAADALGLNDDAHPRSLDVARHCRALDRRWLSACLHSG